MTAAEKSRYERFLEEEKWYEAMDKFFDAMDAGDYERAKEACGGIVLQPEAAMKSFRVMGKKQLLATGFNLSAANAAFGEGWMDAQPEPRGFR